MTGHQPAVADQIAADRSIYADSKASPPVTAGFAHAWAELETMARAAISVVVVVLNNGVLGYQKDAETVKLGRYTTACHLGDVDHAAIARACGVAASRVETPAELEKAFDEAFGSGQPWLLDVVTDPVAHPPVSL